MPVKKTVQRKLKTVNRRLKLLGYSLVEILVVIVIIGILASIIVSQIAVSTQKARDSRRKEDLEAIGKALYIARTDSSSGTFFPDCSNGHGRNGCTLDTGTETSPYLTDYLKTIPHDPKTNAGYSYYPQPSGPSVCNDTSQNPCTAYQLVACLEYSKDPSAVADSTECPNTGYKYVVTNF